MFTGNNSKKLPGGLLEEDFPKFRDRVVLTTPGPVRIGSFVESCVYRTIEVWKDGTRGDDDDDVRDSSDDEWSHSEWECVIDDADRCDARVETVRAVVRDDDDDDEWW